MVLASASSPIPPKAPGGIPENNDWTKPAISDNNTDPDVIQAVDSISGNSIDELANTNFPPPGMNPKRAAEQLAYMKTMTRNARQFYEADRLLDQEDRVTLFKAFRYQMFSQYVGAAVGLVVGITSPKYICKYLNKPYKPLYSTFSGLVTVLAGYSIAEQAAYQHNLRTHQGNSKYLNVFKSIEKFPPLIGYAYYQETIRRPDSTFPDPSKFDWSRYPAFPLTLAMFGRYRADVKGIEPGVYTTPQGYRGISRSQSTTPHTTYSQESSIDDGTKNNSSVLDLPSDEQASRAHQPPGHSTWDKIRAENNSKPFQWEPQHPLHPQGSSSAQGNGSAVVGSRGYTPSYARVGLDTPPPSDLETMEDPFAEESK